MSLNQYNLDPSAWMNYFDKSGVSLQPLQIYRDLLTLSISYDELTSLI
jgi:hypothetical protein